MTLPPKPNPLRLTFDHKAVQLNHDICKSIVEYKDQYVGTLPVLAYIKAVEAREQAIKEELNDFFDICEGFLPEIAENEELNRAIGKLFVMNKQLAKKEEP